METKIIETTIYSLKMHETLIIIGSINGMDKTEKKMEVTRVPGGWIYAFEFPGFRQAPMVFVPFEPETKGFTKSVTKTIKK